ncbi:hypothetical protein TRICI_005945 [Trichomonascus ciferrii]|uniref:C2H2-type domain-containing protein n=1 Tax=Trichomonascus ciferrii TaxID=44093 RepID=A0A642UML8_9ASCO|nr:hypothetical protein TRICI_005945 [Trichomonascus ciferrii]
MGGKFECTYKGCTKSFNRRDYLERHAANHLPVKPFTCGPCNRSFARSDLYENHLLTKYHLKRAEAKSVGGITKKRTNSKSTKCSISSILSPPASTPASPVESPISSTSSGSDIYGWLFSDITCLNYHEIYTGYSRKCAINSRQVGHSPMSFARSILVSPEKARKVNWLLEGELSSVQMSNCVDLAWCFAKDMPSLIIHRPTFVLEDQDDVLVACLVLIGAYYDTSNNNSIDIRKSMEKLCNLDYFRPEHTQSLLFQQEDTHEHSQSLLFLEKEAKSTGSTTLGEADHGGLGACPQEKTQLGFLQSVALLVWFENVLRMRSSLLSQVRPVVEGCRLHLESATHYHLETIDSRTWRRWLDYEAANRSLVFIAYCGFVFHRRIVEVSACLPCPDALWATRSAEDFSVVNGCDPSVPLVPYLWTLKSLLRIPKLHEQPVTPQVDDASVSTSHWSQFSLALTLFGLIDVADTTMNSGLAPRSRLSNGLKLWQQYYREQDHNNAFLSTTLRGLLTRFYEKSLLLHEDVAFAQTLVNNTLFPCMQTGQALSSAVSDVEACRRWIQSDEVAMLVDLSAKYLQSVSRDTIQNDSAPYIAVIVLWLHASLNEPNTLSSDVTSFAANLLNIPSNILLTL